MEHVSLPWGEAERRIRSRWKPVSLLYVELDGSNGGVVLNISETGLAMHTAQTVLQDSVSSLCFKLPPSRERIVARAEIAWKGETHKQLGVRFLDLPEAARLEIQRWIQADSGPRRLPEKVRPISPRKVLPIVSPALPAPPPADPEAAPPRASGDGEEARYPISTAMAFARREAHESERAAARAAAGAKGAAGASAVTAPPTPARSARTGTGSHPAPSSIPAESTVVNPPVAPARAKPAAMPPAAMAARALIPTVLPLGPEAESAHERGMAAQAAAQHSQRSRRRLLAGAALTLVSFLLGLAVGGRSRTSAAREFFAELVKDWDAAVAYTAPNRTVAPEQARAGKAAGAEKVSPGNAPPEQAAESKPAPQPAAKPSEPRNPPSLPTGVRSTPAPARTVARSKSGTNSNPVPAARAQDSAAAEGAISPPAPGAESAAAKPIAEESLTASPPRPAAEPATPAPVAGDITGTVSVHSRLRAIRIPYELRFPNALQNEGLQAGELLSGEPPDYPQEALRARVEGTVNLRAVIGRDGRMVSVEVVKGPPVLAAASLAVVRGWRYEPTLLGGEPVEWEEDITVVFHLQNSSAAQK